MAIHVDDMVVPGKKVDGDDLRKRLNKLFLANGLGGLSHYVGCTFERGREVVTMTVPQLAYIERPLDRFVITASSPIPAYPTVELRPREAEEDECGRRI